MSFGKWLREHRKKADLTLKDVAARARLSFSYVSTLEREQPHSLTGGEILPTRAKVEALAKAVGGDVSEALALNGYASTNGHNGILEGFDALSREDQELASRQIKAIIEIFLSKGAVVEVPSHAAPVINEQRKVA